MASITLKGREIPLIYTVYEMKAAQEEICPLAELPYRIMGQDRDDPKDMSRFGGVEHIDTITKMIRIMGNGGLEEAGEAPDLTDKWVMRSLRPTQMTEVINACIMALNEGMASEIKEERKEGPIDVTLENMNKKKEKDG
jgi:hypothetical protein